MTVWVLLTEKEYGDWYYNTMVFDAVFQDKESANEYIVSKKLEKYELKEVEFGVSVREE